jgi:hypothetical protein
MERNHERRVQELQDEFHERETRARVEDAARIADLRTGVDSLRLEVTSCRRSGVSSSGTSSEEPDGDGRAELAPETSATLWRIAADGDTYARRLKGLQDWAHSAVKLCNGCPVNVGYSQALFRPPL